MSGRRLLPALSTRADLIGVALMAGLTLAFAFGLIAPMALHERQARSQSEAIVRTQQHANGIAAGIRVLDRDVEQTRQQLAATPLQIRPLNTMNARLAVVVRLAGECGLSVDDLKPGDAVRGPRFVSVPIRMSGRGGYPNAARFFHELHEHASDLTVSGFDLAADIDSKQAGRYRFELRWLALPDAPAAPISGPAIVAVPLQ